MIIEIGTDISNLPNEEGAHLVTELLFVLMRGKTGVLAMFKRFLVTLKR